MDNKKIFNKSKLALAIVLSVGLTACGGDDGDAGSTSTATTTSASQSDATQNTVGNQNELTGTVQGVVVSSNGNPLAGVAVYLGAQETTTNAGGQYVFTNVAVTNVNGTNNEGDETADSVAQTLVVTIGGTADYLGALVTVSPQAQVNNTGGTGNGTGTDGNNSVTTIQTFIDGFTAEAGVAVLPMLNAGTYGYVRDCRTGQPLASTADVLSLDFLSLSADVTTTPVGSGIQLTTAEDNHTISTDADGKFSLDNIAANSTYTISAKKGWSITSGLGTISDTDVTVSTAFDAGIDSTTTSTVTTVSGGTTVATTTTVVVVDADNIATTTVTVVTTSPVASVSTGSEASSEFLNTIEVCPVDFVETPYVPTPPMIKAINGQIGTTELAGDAGSTYTYLGDHDDNTSTPDTTAAQVHPYAALNQGVVNDFVIWFTEEMSATFDLSEARVKVDGDTVSDATVTLSADGDSVTVTFVDDLPEGSKVDVWFPYWSATDAQDSMFLVNNTKIGYDAVAVATTSKALYAHAFFCTFSKPINGAVVTLGPQVFDADTTEDGNSADLAVYSTAFQDNDDADNTGATVITQLNDGDAASGTRLAALALARGVTVTIDQDYAVVAYDGTGAASLIWKHGTTTVVPGTTVGYDIVGTGANTELHITPAAHNDTISVTPVNGFGDVITAGTMSVTLIDAIAPTTVLQESYNITDATGPRVGEDVVGGTTANASFGNGGEISAPGTTATAAGEPIIHIQPRHLAGQTSGTADRNNELNTLTAGMSARLTAAEVTAIGGAAAAQAAMSVSTILAHDMPIYDATAIAGWAAIPATIGVAFNENVTLTTTAPAFSGSTALSGYAALNNVAANVDGQVVAVDLVTFNTPSVIALSLDAGADLGFVGSVTDSRSNVSTANAQVFIQDTFPPMMTASIWNGVTLALTFNEPVVIPSGGTSINVIDPVTTTNVRNVLVTTTNSTVVGNVLTITLSAADNVAIAPLFVNGASNEFLYDDDTTATTEESHALIDWDLIADATGNEWSEFNPTLSASNRGLEVTPAGADTRRWEVVAPRFLAVNGVGAFTVTYAYAGLAAGAGPDADGFTATITFSHPLNFGSLAPAAKTHFVEKSDGDNDDIYFENVADIQRLMVLDLNADGIFDAADAFPAGTTAAWINSGGTTRLDLVVPAGMSVVYGLSELVFASDDATPTSIADLTATDVFVTGDVVSSLTIQTRSVSDVINN